MNQLNYKIRIEKECDKLGELFFKAFLLCNNEEIYNYMMDNISKKDEYEISSITDNSITWGNYRKSYKLEIKDNEFRTVRKLGKKYSIKQFEKLEDSYRIFELNNYEKINKEDENFKDGRKEVNFDAMLFDNDNNAISRLKGHNKFNYFKHIKSGKEERTGKLDSEIIIDRDPQYLIKLEETIETDGTIRAYIGEKPDMIDYDIEDKLRYKEVLYDTVKAYLNYQATIDELVASSYLIQKPKTRRR